MENQFKKGDRVFVYPYGWGEYHKYHNCDGAIVNFDNMPYYVNASLISFTEYTLQGFTQQRPFEPEIGKFYWFWDEGQLQDEEITYGKLTDIDKDGEDFLYHTSTNYFYYISDKNPLP